MWGPDPALCHAVPGLCPWAGGSPSVPSVVTVPSAGMHMNWGPGMKKSAGKTQIVEKKSPTPKKSKQSLSHLSTREKKTRLSWKGEKLEYCETCDVAINEELTLIISFAFPEEIKIFSSIGRSSERGTFAHSDVL